MSVLTKVFVVLVAILAVVLVALVVPFVARTDDYRKLLEDSKDQQQVLRLTAQNASAGAAAAQATVDKERLAAASAQKSLADTIDGLNTKLADAEAKAASARSNAAMVSAGLESLTEAEKQHAQINDILQKQVTTLREDLLKEQKARVDLAGANDKLETDFAAAKRQLARQQEEMTLLEDKNTELEARWATVPIEIKTRLAGAGTGNQPPFEPGPMIRGQITKIQKVDNSTFAEINVGTADHVAKNMKFLVYRGTQYLGTLVINSVDNKAAAGTLQLATGQQVNKGDGVLTGGTY